MPLYEYRCTSCGEKTEVLQRLAEAPLRICPHCGGSLTKILSAPALQFKGTGWYVTDYARGGGRRGAEEGAHDDAKASADKAGPKPADPAEKPATPASK
jgi:putative FmdB family regulatory protein